MTRRYTIYFEGGAKVRVWSKFVSFDGRTVRWGKGNIEYLNPDKIIAIVRG